jgi:PKD repeat protein
LGAWITAAIVVSLACVGTASATPPTGDFNISDGVPNIGQSVTFTATGLSDPDGGTIAGVSWSFGDGATDSGTTVSHPYTTAGAKTIAMTVTDSGGESTTVTHSLGVNARRRRRSRRRPACSRSASRSASMERRRRTPKGR